MSKIERVIPHQFIQHFSHEHHLRLQFLQSLFPVTLGSYANCSLCQLSPIGRDDQVYSCDDCKYYIHKECAELPPHIAELPLPRHIDHLLHPHHNPLKLDNIVKWQYYLLLLLESLPQQRKSFLHMWPVLSPHAYNMCFDPHTHHNMRQETKILMLFNLFAIRIWWNWWSMMIAKSS